MASPRVRLISVGTDWGRLRNSSQSDWPAAISQLDPSRGTRAVVLCRLIRSGSNRRCSSRYPLDSLVIRRSRKSRPASRRLTGAWAGPTVLTMTTNEHDPGVSERQAHAEATYERLFGPRDKGALDNDPELMEILRRFIFGDVFDTGVLDDQTRELITVTVLACLQTLPQLTSHTGAALNVGVEPVAIREAVYQLAPLIGFPRTLNAVATINEVFQSRGIALPLPEQGTVTNSERYTRGLAAQAPLYGNEIKDNLADLPDPFNTALPRFLTEFCFGDFYSRDGLTVARRELLVLCALATIGDTAAQLGPHGRACIQTGNSKTTVVAALAHCFLYIGFPRAVAAIRAVKDL